MGLLDSILTQVMQGQVNQGGAAGQAPAGGDLMGSLLGALLGGGQMPQQGQPQAAPGGMGGMGSGMTGALVAAGVSMLVAKLQQGGLQETVNSWVGHGENQPVAPDALHKALGPEQVQTMSAQTGLPTGALMGVLAAALPQLINGLTPQGRLPEAHEVPHDVVAGWPGGKATG